MIGRLISLSPEYIEYHTIVILPSSPPNVPLYKHAIRVHQVFGTYQFMKIAGLYMEKKILSKISERYSLEKVARKEKMLVMKTNALRSQEAIERLKSSSPDVILSIASSRIFGDDILAIPRWGCINVHAGMLPKYRGVNPSFWSLLNREKQSAVTAHYMNDKIDDGDIIQQNVFDIEGINSLHEVYLRILDISPKTVVDALVAISKGSVNTIRNDSSRATYYSFPTKKEGKKFRSLGLKYMCVYAICMSVQFLGG